MVGGAVVPVVVTVTLVNVAVVATGKAWLVTARPT